MPHSHEIVDQQTASLLALFEANPEAFMLFSDMALHDQATTEVAIDAATRFKETSFKDQLTGATNRHGLDDGWPGLIAHAKRHDEDVSLLAIDLDGFKKVNDSEGHAAGDEILKKVTKVFFEETRDNDMVVRPGGDEFVIVLSNSDVDTAAVVAERIRKTVTGLGKVGLSVGLLLVDKEKSLGENLELADQALYKAKRNGRGKVVIHKS